MPTGGVKSVAADDGGRGDVKRRRREEPAPSDDDDDAPLAPPSAADRPAAGANFGPSEPAAASAAASSSREAKPAEGGNESDYDPLGGDDSSDSSGADSDDDAAPGDAAGAPGDAQAAEGKLENDEEEEDDDSSSSSSKSSSSSSSSSESESEAEEPEARADVALGEPESESEAEEEKTDEFTVEVARRAQMKRSLIVDMILDLPEEEYAIAVLKSFVRIVIKPGAPCAMAQVVEIVPAAQPYEVSRKNGDQRHLDVQLRCSRGKTEKLVKISAISDSEISDLEFMNWKTLTFECGGEKEMTEHYTTVFRRKQEDIIQAQNFKWDEKAIGEKLARKTNQNVDLEFDAQKESRFRAMVQTTLSQMDISGIRENEDASGKEATYKEALEHLHKQEQKAAESQNEWFKMRPDLYSLKMINEKNLAKQYADDKHALEYTLDNEASGQGGLNPFQRRACRPVCAWDTALTGVEKDKAEGSEPSASSSSQAAVPAAPVATAVPVGVNGTAREDAGGEAAASSAGPQQPMARMDSILQAHRRANLLGKLKFPALMTAKAA